MSPPSHLLGLDGEGQLRVLGTLRGRLAAAAVGDAVDAVDAAAAGAGGGLAGHVAGPVAGLQVVTVDQTTWNKDDIWYCSWRHFMAIIFSVLVFVQKSASLRQLGDLITAPIANKSCWFPVKVNLKCILNV